MCANTESEHSLPFQMQSTLASAILINYNCTAALFTEWSCQTIFHSLHFHSDVLLLLLACYLPFSFYCTNIVNVVCGFKVGIGNRAQRSHSHLKNASHSLKTLRPCVHGGFAVKEEKPFIADVWEALPFFLFHYYSNMEQSWVCNNTVLVISHFISHIYKMFIIIIFSCVFVFVLKQENINGTEISVKITLKLYACDVHN